MPETPRRLPRSVVAVAAIALLPACTLISSRDNASAAIAIAGKQQVGDARWRRDAEAEREAWQRVEELLRGDVTAAEAVDIALLANPEVQLAFEALEVSRAELVAASTPPNPVAIVGARQPGGNLSAFYPDRNVSVGVLQNVLALVNLPSRRRIANTELERARIEAADRIVALAAEVNEAYIQYAAALRIDELRREAGVNARAMLELLRQQSGDGADAQAVLLGERAAMVQVEAGALRSALDVSTARARLARLMGVAGRAEDWRLADGLPPLPATDPDPRELELQALEKRLDLAGARKAVEARLDAAGVQARWRWAGAVELGVFRESVSGGTRFTGPNALVELPLFDQRQAQILSTSAESRAAMRQLEAGFLEARAQIRTHAAELATTRALLTRYDQEVLPDLRRARELQDPSSFDARRTAAALLAAEEERVGLLRDYWRARGALSRAAGDWQPMPRWPTATQAGAAAP